LAFFASEVGPCRSRLRRYYYDAQTGRCKQFWFGGCLGNDNNFVDERDCIDTCVDDSHLARSGYGRAVTSAEIFKNRFYRSFSHIFAPG
jgi:hypothetical protein